MTKIWSLRYANEDHIRASSRRRLLLRLKQYLLNGWKQEEESFRHSNMYRRPVSVDYSCLSLLRFDWLHLILSYEHAPLQKVDISLGNLQQLLLQ